MSVAASREGLGSLWVGETGHYFDDAELHHVLIRTVLSADIGSVFLAELHQAPLPIVTTASMKRNGKDPTGIRQLRRADVAEHLKLPVAFLPLLDGFGFSTSSVAGSGEERSARYSISRTYEKLTRPIRALGAGLYWGSKRSARRTLQNT